MGISIKEYRSVVREIRKYTPNIKIKIDDDAIIESLEPGTQACYCHQDDTIYTREPHYYRSTRMLRHVLFHELAHWATREGRAGRVRKFALNIDKDPRVAHSLNCGLEEIIVDAVAHHFCVISGKSYSKKAHEKYINNWAERVHLDLFWDKKLQRYFHRKINTLISFIKNNQK